MLGLYFNIITDIITDTKQHVFISYKVKTSVKPEFTRFPRDALYHRGPRTLKDEEIRNIYVADTENMIGQGGFSKVYKGKLIDLYI